MRFAAACLFALIGLATPAVAQAQSSWIDPTTGHRIVRITDEPGASMLYFTQTSFTPQGDKMVITTANGIGAIDLKTWKISPVIPRTESARSISRRERSAPWSTARA